MDSQFLTENEARFCLLYTNGAAPLSGNARLCYQRLFPGTSDEDAAFLAKEMLNKKEVKERIAKLNEVSLHSAEYIRPQTTETLLKIMHECTNSEYSDKDGIPLSPAALRAVSVNAARELNSMYGIKEEIAQKVKIETDGQNGIVFNVIAPATKAGKEDDNED